MHRSLPLTLARMLAITLLATLALAAARPAGAAVYTVTKTADTADGACNADCSLREAVLAANANSGPDFILLAAGVYKLTIPGQGEDLGATGDLDIRDDVFLVGAAAGGTILDGNNLDRVLDIQAGVHVEIQGVTIRFGTVAGDGAGIRNAGSLSLAKSIVTRNSTTDGGDGGGIWSRGASSELTVTQSTISGNGAEGDGGGLAVGGPARVSNTTIADNVSENQFGGGIYVYANTDALFWEVTIVHNLAAKQGGGIFAEGSPFTGINHPELRDAILASNSASSQRDCSGAVRSGSHNLIGDGFDCIDFTAAHHDLVGTTAAPLDPKLGPLGGNGGPTPTLALLAGSPALGQGGACGETDQRGLARPATGCDIGAFQTGPGCVTGGPTLCLNNDRFQVTVTWKTAQGTLGAGQGVSLTADSGYFWFFDPTNVELTVKVLNGCNVNNRYWVFLSGLTNVDVTVTVTDTAKGTTKTYRNPLNTTFVTKLDTAAFASCP